MKKRVGIVLIQSDFSYKDRSLTGLKLIPMAFFFFHLVISLKVPFPNSEGVPASTFEFGDRFGEDTIQAITFPEVSKIELA